MLNRPKIGDNGWQKDKYSLDAALIQQRFQRRSVQIFVLHALPQQVDSLLQHRAEARIAPGFDQFLGETVLFVGQRDRRF